MLGLQGFPWQSLFAGAPLQLPARPAPWRAQILLLGTFPPVWVFQRVWASAWPIPAEVSFPGDLCGSSTAGAGRVNLAKQAETSVMKGAMSPSLSPFQLQLLLFSSQEVASPEHGAFPAPRNSRAVTRGNRACFLPQFHPAPFLACSGSPWGQCPAPGAAAVPVMGSGPTQQQPAWVALPGWDTATSHSLHSWRDPRQDERAVPVWRQPAARGSP